MLPSISIENNLSSDGSALWSKYETTRNEIVEQVLRVIGSQETNLSDHGPDHIRDVMGNATLLLGLRNEYLPEAAIAKCAVSLSVHELLLLTLGILVHDIGNVLKRPKHNQRIAEVWSKLPTWNLWTKPERELIVSVGRAHTGATLSSGPENTLEQLAISRHYFHKVPVNLAEIAAIVRFADELAEGPQRTSAYMLAEKLFDESSQIYHQYARITCPAAIDHARGLIALSYTIGIDEVDFPKERAELCSLLEKLLALVHHRACKLDFERRFTRHYSPTLARFKEMSVSISFHRGAERIEPILNPITLRDFSVHVQSSNLLELTDPKWAISSVVTSMLEAT